SRSITCTSPYCCSESGEQRVRIVTELIRWKPALSQREGSRRTATAAPNQSRNQRISKAVSCIAALALETITSPAGVGLVIPLGNASSRWSAFPRPAHHTAAGLPVKRGHRGIQSRSERQPLANPRPAHRYQHPLAPSDRAPVLSGTLSLRLPMLRHCRASQGF